MVKYRVFTRKDKIEDAKKQGVANLMGVLAHGREGLLGEKYIKAAKVDFASRPVCGRPLCMTSFDELMTDNHSGQPAGGIGKDQQFWCFRHGGTGGGTYAVRLMRGTIWVFPQTEACGVINPEENPIIKKHLAKNLKGMN